MATSKFEKITIPETTIIAISASGSFFVAFIFGSPHIINMVKPTKPTIYHKETPSNHTLSVPSIVLNIPNCDKKITIAKPFTNPIITGCGINLTNLPNLKRPAKTWRTPIRITVKKR